MDTRLTRNIPFLLLLALSACGGTEDEIDQSVSAVVEAAKFEPIDSPRLFEESLQEIGNAKGYGFAKFEVTFERTTFSDDCEASFLQAEGFAPEIPVEELEEIIANGYPSRTAFLNVYYRGGEIWFLEYGDTDIKGAINEDGTFRIVSGEYPRPERCRFFVFEGQLEGDSMEGTFQYFIHSWDEEPTGRCHFESPFHGKASSGIYYPEPPQ